MSDLEKGLVNRAVVGKWNEAKTEYRELEVDTSSCKDHLEVESVVRRTAALVDKMLLDLPMSRETREKEWRQEVQQRQDGTTITIPSEEALNKLPWKRYDRSDAGPGERAWIQNPSHFSTFECEGMNDLLQLVKCLDGSPVHKMLKAGEVPVLRVEGMEYSYSFGKADGGKPERIFITREPVKDDSAR